MDSRSPAPFPQLGLFVLCGVLALPLAAQTSTGELRLAVRDSSGSPVPAHVELTNDSAHVRQSVQVPASGTYAFKNLPFGAYRLAVSAPGLAASSELVEIRSEVPSPHTTTLGVESVRTSVEVKDSATLIDPSQVAASAQIGAQQIQERPAGAPSRGLIDLIAMQPGWLLEANGILHPRESEYDTQFVVDGFPLQENRSPAFLRPVGADQVESMKTYASGIPAEFGNKLGGVVEINTTRNTSPGFHGEVVAGGGSFDTGTAFVSGQYVTGKTTSTLSSEGFLTDRYLDPAVTDNYTNHGSSTSLTGAVEHDFSSSNRLRVSVSRQQTWFEVPNDYLQQDAGQRQDRSSLETDGRVSFQHVFSPDLLGVVRASVRDVAANFWSNPLSTPIQAEQDRGFHEEYLNGSLSGHSGANEWKTGFDVRYASIHEQFGYQIVSYDLNGESVFDDNLPPTFSFQGHSPDREQALYAQDVYRFRDLTASIGLRFDHYDLLVNEAALSPRLGVAYNVKRLGLVLHASYDRTFGTPPFENLLVSAAPETRFGSGLYLPLRPSRGNYYEFGFAKSLGNRVRLDANYYLREVRDFEDDDLLLNTGVSFPISYHHADIRGVEVKLEIPRIGPFSGFLNYSNTTGVGQNPITGGLFLDDSDIALAGAHDKFPISQDERNAARAKLRYQIHPRLWTAWSASYSSGLPVEDAGDLPDSGLLIAQFGASVFNQVNFDRGRVHPTYSLDASLGADLLKSEKRSLSLQVDGFNLTDRLNVINFAGLLSGTAVAPPRSYSVRLRATF